MSTEVKMVYGEIEEQLGLMNDAATSLNPQGEPPITGNVLDTVTKLTELSERLEQLLTKYQTVLLQNIETTKNSVEYMRETDENVSTGIKGATSGPRREAL